MDTLNLRSQERGHSAYVNAEEVEPKLRRARASVGATHLCGVTSLPLSDTRETDLTMWWNDTQDVSIASVAGFIEQLTPPEFSLERLMANLLAFVLSGLPLHTKGSKNCPSYYNGELDIRYAAGLLTFCRVCEQRFKKNKMPAERRAALAALTRAYPA
jgi:hypothetical protein